MDSALQLKMLYDNGASLSKDEIDHLLYSSQLVQMLTSELKKTSLFPIWRLLALAEIPYAARLKYTQELMKYVDEAYFASVGYTLTGNADDILPCYNAMLVEAYSKLGWADTNHVRSAVEWIKNYQVFERNKKTAWDGRGIKKYGGCMRETPCYIGIAKSVKALIYYSASITETDDHAKKSIEKGMAYLLQHNLYQRMSNNEPITKHILDIAYPQSYQLNIVELLDIAYHTENINNPRVKSAAEYIKTKRTKNNDWKINYVYQADGYVSFDKRGDKGEWVSYLLSKFLTRSG